jgi:hypothetical protein
MEEYSKGTQATATQTTHGNDAGTTTEGGITATDKTAVDTSRGSGASSQTVNVDANESSGEHPHDGPNNI